MLAGDVFKLSFFLYLFFILSPFGWPFLSQVPTPLVEYLL